jgi:diguanylate cyclase (GGDEF)-like protein
MGIFDNKSKVADVSPEVAASKGRMTNQRRQDINSDVCDDDSQYHSDIHLELNLNSNSATLDSYEHNDQPKESDNIVERFKALRTQQLIVAVFAATAIVLFNNVFHDRGAFVVQVLLATLGVFAGCYYMVKKGAVLLGGFVFLWTLYVTLTLLMIKFSGLRDPAVLGFLAILIFAAMLNHKTHFLCLAATIGMTLAGVGTAAQKGWIDFSLNPFGWDIVIEVLIIYLVASYAIWTLANDLRFTLKRLQSENSKVLESKEAYQKIAHYDHLTQLPNRLIALDRFNQATFHAQRLESQVAILFIDLDNFKTVNDSLGHAVGDGLLREIANRLSLSVRDGDTVCRLGGDEFLIILDDIHEQKDITRIANQVLNNISSPIDIEEHCLTATCSIGIAIAPTDGEDFDTIRKKADIAMYKAKNAGRNGMMYFDDLMNKDMLAHIDRVNSLRRAITNEEFILYYQPKVDLKSGRIRSAEALIRWKTIGGQIIPPDEFIPIAENTGMIIEIGEWVLYEACRQCKEFQQKGLSDFSIAVNLSSIQFRRGNLESIVISALEAAQLDPSYLELEVTESLLVENSDDIRKQFRALQKSGVTFSIDDFGTGYSSLAYLKDFNFDFLKIDRTFIGDCIENENHRVLCQAIVTMAHKLQLMVVAEGLETKQQIDVLTEAGCEFGQGNFFSEALPVDRFYQLQSINIESPKQQDSVTDYIVSLV